MCLTPPSPQFPLFWFIRFLCAQLSSLSRSRWMAAQSNQTTITDHPVSSAWGIFCWHMLPSRLPLSLKQRRCNAACVCPPIAPDRFFPSPCGSSAQFPPEGCAAVTSRGKDNFQGSGTLCSYFGSSLLLTAPSQPSLTFRPLLETRRLSRGLKPAPSPNHREAVWNAVTLRKPQLSCGAVSTNVPSGLRRGWPAASGTEEATNPCAAFCKCIFTAFANQTQGTQMYPLYDGLHTTDWLLSVKILHRLSSGKCTVFHINISSATNEILDAFWQRA